MTPIYLSETLVRALFHFLWEGAAIGLALAAAIHLLHPSSARVRYALSCLAMLMMLACFGITIARFWPHLSGAPQNATLTLRNPADGLAPLYGNRARSAPAPSRFQWIAALWMVGVFVLTLRTLVSWIAVIRIRRVGVCAASPEWQDTVARLARRIRLSTPVVLLESALTDTPAVVGLLRPAILIPAGLLTGFPPEQLEFIFLHELAHIRRYDYFVNVLQSLTEDLLFYHPAVWWVSSLIRSERENCCDDVVVAATGNPRGLAVVLATLEQNRWAAHEAALAANGGHLMNRIRRLVEVREHLRPTAAPAFVAGLLLAAVSLAVAASAPQAKPVGTSPVPIIAAPVPQTVIPAAATPVPSRREPVLLAQTPTPVPATTSEPDATPDTPYKRWLREDVVYIISEEERQAFRRLMTDEERQIFIEQFWLRRDPTPSTAANEMQEEHYRRLAYAVDNFSVNGIPGWKTDFGMIYIKFGPPDEKEQERGTTTTLPVEKWRYRYLQGIGTNVTIEFVDTQRNGEFHMTKDPVQIATDPARNNAKDRFARTDGANLGPANTPAPEGFCVNDTASNRVQCLQKVPSSSDQFQRPVK